MTDHNLSTTDTPEEPKTGTAENQENSDSTALATVQPNTKPASIQSSSASSQSDDTTRTTARTAASDITAESGQNPDEENPTTTPNPNAPHNILEANFGIDAPALNPNEEEDDMPRVETNDTTPTTAPMPAEAANRAASTTAPPERSNTTPTNAAPATNNAASPTNNQYTAQYFEEFKVIPEGTWPPPLFIKRNVHPRERYYLEYRWHSQWAYYDKRANENKKNYFRLQTIVVIGSVVVPVLISLNTNLATLISAIIAFAANALSGPETTFVAADFVNTSRLIVDTVTVFISLAVAGAAAYEGLQKYGDNWRTYRQAAEELQAEKSFYDMGTGRYQDNAQAFARFVERCEEIIAKQNGQFIQTVDRLLVAQSEQNQRVLDTTMGESGDFDDDNTATTPNRTTSQIG